MFALACDAMTGCEHVVEWVVVFLEVDSPRGKDGGW